MAIVDDFFSKPNVTRKLVVRGSFEDHTAEQDQVVYPGINKYLPKIVVDEYHAGLSKLFQREILPVVTFARLTTPKLPQAPHAIHCDVAMSQFAAQVYLSRSWERGSGTGFFEHLTYGSEMYEPGDECLQEHSNDLSKWDLTGVCRGKFNRLLVHDSRLWHCALPVGGWGESAIDGRLVLTCFFN